jgi:hypothetical protein
MTVFPVFVLQLTQRSVNLPLQLLLCAPGNVPRSDLFCLSAQAVGALPGKALSEGAWCIDAIHLNNGTTRGMRA